MSCLRSRALGATFLLLTGAAAAAPGDWPQFRGPYNNDLSPETGLLKDWLAGGPPLVWKGKDLGEGFSSVAVAANRIYTAGDKGDAGYMVALSAADGKPLWSARLGKPGADPNGPRATPTVDGARLYAVGQWGELVCLQTADGRELWRKDYATDFGGVRPNWGYTESALVDGNQVIVTPGGAAGAMMALNKQTGALIWRSQQFTDAPHYATPIAVNFGGVRQYIQLTAQSVAGIAAKDGELLWRAPRRGETAVIPSPIFRDGLVYVASGYGIGCNLFKVTAAAGKFSVQQVYANKVMVNHHGAVILVADCLYGHSDEGGWTCQDFQTGQAKWRERQKLGKGSLTYADGRLYLREEGGRGTLALIEPSPEGFKEHGRFAQPDRSSKNSWPHPVVAGGKLYLRDQDLLLCYDVKAK